MSLDELRKDIDKIDDEIVSLLNKRADVARDIGREKNRRGLPLRQPEREREVLDSLAARSNGAFSPSGLENVYRLIMTETLALQNRDAECAARRDGKNDIPATVTENRLAAPGFFRMRLEAPGLSFRPGQFFQLRVPGGDGLFLRRPFAPASVDDRGLTFFYAVVGRGTGRMSALRPGEEVGLLAPLGNAFTPLPAGSRALIVGGGCGAPSLATLSRSLKDAGVETTVIVGARTSSALLEIETFSRAADRLVLATDDGSEGCRGTVIDAYRLREAEISGADRIYGCGPLPMLRAAAKLAEETGADCEVSLEERMACGFGVCLGCAAPVRDEASGGMTYRRVCHEGPVFNSRVLLWDSMRR